MKLIPFVLLLPILLISWNVKLDQNSNKSTQNVLEQSSTIANESQEPGLSGSSINIKDIFLLLPENVFPEVPTTVAQREELLKCIGEEKALEISPTPIGVCDVRNGYLNLTGMQYDWEVSYWNLKDNRKLIIVNHGKESGSILNYFFYENGKLNEDLNYDAIRNMTFKADDFIRLSELNPNMQNEVEQKFASASYTFYYRLPKKRTSIQVVLDTDALMDYSTTNEIPYEASKEVILKWENETWVKEVTNELQISAGAKWLKSIFQCSNGSDYCFPDEEKVITERYYEFFVESLGIFEYPDFETEDEQIAAENAYKKKRKDIYPLDIEVLSPFGRGNGIGSGDQLKNVTITPHSETKFTVIIDYGDEIKTTTELTLIANGNSFLIDYMKSEYIE